MKDPAAVDLDRAELKKLPQVKLIQMLLEKQQQLHDKENRILELTEQLGRINQQQDEQKHKAINKTVHEPTSKKPEWDKDGNPKQRQAKKRKGKRSKRPGCGNQEKVREVDQTHFIPLRDCPECGKNLTNRPGSTKTGRMVEDIDPPQAKTNVWKEIEETKWCPKCKKMVCSKTERALPGSDIGLNATIEMAYLWVMSALSMPKIQALSKAFKALTLSTAGISRMMIRLSRLLQPVYDEILADVKQGTHIWADETGWRVKGKLWWLWIFANQRSAFYWAEQCRGGPVVERILGPIFWGVLIVDGWQAYNRVTCPKQTCMAHIFRKIRAFIDAYPTYRSIMAFYLKLRRIIKNGEKLQQARGAMNESVFQRRLTTLHCRLDELLTWKNPNAVLTDIINKVRRQRQHILTFVEHEGTSSHNNYGEYIIKKGVLKRKVSGGSMSAQGARAYACIQSIAMTCQLRNLSFHRFLRASLVHYIRTGTPMLLADYEASLHSQQQAA